jgi:GntR family transcriptional regulator
VALLSVDPRDPTPIYAQLERGLRAAIATSRVRPGDQLPTVRQLAVDLRINANTVARVYAELERAGVIETRRGVGSFVTPAHAGASTSRGTIAACGPSSPACWPTPTRPASLWTMWSVH